jgi:hypothetical protein
MRMDTMVLLTCESDIGRNRRVLSRRPLSRLWQ